MGPAAVFVFSWGNRDKNELRPQRVNHIAVPRRLIRDTQGFTW